jgi:hypothetical protein
LGSQEAGSQAAEFVQQLISVFVFAVDPVDLLGDVIDETAEP